MRKFIITACASVVLTGLAFAQTSGMPSATPAAFYKIQPADLRITTLIGTRVVNANNENIGKVEDVLVDKGKTVQAIVLGVGGFLGVGERSVAIAPESIALTKLTDGSIKAVVNTTKKDLENAPEVKLSTLN